MLGNSLHIGSPLGGGKSIELSPEARGRHLYVCGGTGVGKSKFLEDCIRQDILNWSDSECGLILFDPHGLVYKNTMAWIAKHELKRPVIPIDLRRDDWIISYNLLRQRKDSDPFVVVSNFVRALAYVWGEAGTDATPLFARWASIILLTLYQNGYTISDVMHLLSRDDVRRAMVAKLQDQGAIRAWRMAEKQPKEFEAQITSTLNRFERLAGPQVMKATLGQPDVSLDLAKAMDEGKIILVNLSTEGRKIDTEHSDTFATLLLADLWAAAQSRPKAEGNEVKPFYVYVDECQRFITPTIADNLEQARGYGLHLTLANQYPKRLKNAGPQGQLMYDAILAVTGNKIVFRLEHPEDAKDLALWLFMNALDTDEIKHVLYSTKVVGYRDEVVETRTTGTTVAHGSGSTNGAASFEAVADGVGESGTDAEGTAAALWNSYVANSSGQTTSASENEFYSESQIDTVSTSKRLVPVMGKEISSVQFRSIDEQLTRAMQTLFSQKDRHFGIRYHGGPKEPLFVRTPTVEPANCLDLVDKYREKRLKKLPFAMPMSVASLQLKEREKRLLTEIVDIPADLEPASAKQKSTESKGA